jgi:hypothetical protein
MQAFLRQTLSKANASRECAPDGVPTITALI